MKWENLAPSIIRQRMIIEGKAPTKITDSQIKDYLSKLSDAIEMTTLIEPVTHKSDKFGWAGWIHWETSGAHFYAWDEPFLFSASIFTLVKNFYLIPLLNLHKTISNPLRL